MEKNNYYSNLILNAQVRVSSQRQHRNQGDK